MKGGTIDVQFTTPPAADVATLAKQWIQNAARSVATYYDTFPVQHTVLRITIGDGRKVRNGTAFGWNGPLIKISLGRSASSEELAEDWMLTHEMLHLCFPNLAERHHWLEEGISTYVEPVARARAGLLPPARVWADLVNGLPQGQPEAGDRGLDFTPTWGRTYWGGALFCLRADVEMRRRSGNRRGLEHALRAISSAGGTIEKSWDIDRVIAVGDGAVGAPVLRDLYDGMKDKPVTVDLEAIWKELGVIRKGRSITFDDSAPLAAVRKAITGE